MPAWRREAEALIAGVLGPAPVAWIAWDEVLRGGSELPSLVLTFLGASPGPAERMAALTRIEAALASGGWLVVVDHNRPRRCLGALRALIGVPKVAGWSPAARWRRLAHPTAREVQAAGFGVECLRFAAGERVQLVIGRKRVAG